MEVCLASKTASYSPIFDLKFETIAFSVEKAKSTEVFGDPWREEELLLLLPTRVQIKRGADTYYAT